MSARPVKSASEFIVSLLVRNLFDVFDERDRDSRVAAIQDLYTPDAIFCDPHGHHTGHSGVESAASGLLAMVPADFRFSQRTPPQVLQDSGRIEWAFGPPDSPQKITGTDFVIVRDGRIAAMYTFLDPLP